MRSYLVVLVFVLLNLSGLVLGQAPSPAVLVPEVLSSDYMAAMDDVLNSVLSSEDSLLPQLTPPTVLPVMSPELALQTYQARAAQQATGLASYTSTSVIRAELPESKQQ